MNSLTVPVPDPDPFEVLRPCGASPPPTPFLFASPHSGRDYPEALMQATVLGPDAIRRSEDVFVDKLIAGAVTHGAVVLSATVARAFMDLNRDAWELDPAMFSDELPTFARRRTARVAAGLGSIARVVADGQEIYGRKLTFAEAEGRIASVYKPYHAALEAILAEARAAHGVGVLIDCHSMPAAAGEKMGKKGSKAFDMVLGDRFGAACAPALTDKVERELQALGYRVVRNAPYAGGYVTEFYGRPAKGFHALQIEINRGLYLNETTMEASPGYARLAADLDRLFAALTGDWQGLFGEIPSR